MWGGLRKLGDESDPSEMIPAGDGVSLILSTYERHIKEQICLSLGGGRQAMFIPSLDLSSRMKTNEFYHKIVTFIRGQFYLAELEPRTINEKKISIISLTAP